MLEKINNTTMLKNKDNYLPSEIATVYVKYFKGFLKRADVQDGRYVSYHENQNPFDELKDSNWLNLGDARVTTGFCVSFSQAIMHDPLFEALIVSRGAKAKIVSIDIKEQYYGYCKPNYVQNKWHTAILIQDNNINLILDPTCAQFGNHFVNKFVWDFETWIKTFRSPYDKHVITDFDDNELNVVPFVESRPNETKLSEIENALHNVTIITNTERRMLADFFVNGITLLNKKIELGNLTDKDFKYTTNINRLLKTLTFKNSDVKQYYILKFDNILSLKKWLISLHDNNFILKNYMLLSDTIEDACNLNNIDLKELHDINNISDTKYLIIEFDNCMGSDVSDYIKFASTIVPYGIKVNLLNLFNSGDTLPKTADGIKRQSNTIMLQLSF